MTAAGDRRGCLRWKDTMQSVIIVIHLMLVATLIAAVLLQKSEGGGLGVGGGGGGSGFMSSRGTANLLTRTTGFLAAGFFITSLFLGWWAGYERKPTTLFPGNTAPVSQPGSPLAPPTSGGLLDTLKKADEPQTPAAPAPPRSQ
jgi:preprotein translocase subunit SecG